MLQQSLDLACDHHNYHALLAVPEHDETMMMDVK